METYQCKKHGEVEAYINTYNSSRDGVVTSKKCIVCCNERAKRYRENHRESTSKTKAKWAKENKDKVRASQRKYVVTHPLERQKSVSNWIKNNNDKINFYSRNYSAKKRGSKINDFTLEEWAELQKEHNYSCFYCGCTDKKLTQDHVYPISRGGNHTKSNIVPACQSCNSRKGAKILGENYAF
jgi:5-methylcytosine-specific restriction endonuclease McrA